MKSATSHVAFDRRGVTRNRNTSLEHERDMGNTTCCCEAGDRQTISRLAGDRSTVCDLSAQPGGPRAALLFIGARCAKSGAMSMSLPPHPVGVKFWTKLWKENKDFQHSLASHGMAGVIPGVCATMTYPLYPVQCFVSPSHIAPPPASTRSAFLVNIETKAFLHSRRPSLSSASRSVARFERCSLYRVGAMRKERRPQIAR